MTKRKKATIFLAYSSIRRLLQIVGVCLLLVSATILGSQCDQLNSKAKKMNGTPGETSIQWEKRVFSAPIAGWVLGLGTCIPESSAEGLLLSIAADPSGEESWAIWRVVTSSGERLTLRLHFVPETHSWLARSVSVHESSVESERLGATSVLIRGYRWGMEKSELERLVNSELASLIHESSDSIECMVSDHMEWEALPSETLIESGIVTSWVGNACQRVSFTVEDGRFVEVSVVSELYDTYRGSMRISPPATDDDDWLEWSVGDLIDGH